MVAIVPLRSGVAPESEMSSWTSASPFAVSVMAPTEPTWWPPTVTLSPLTS